MSRAQARLNALVDTADATLADEPNDPRVTDNRADEPAGTGVKGRIQIENPTQQSSSWSSCGSSEEPMVVMAYIRHASAWQDPSRMSSSEETFVAHSSAFCEAGTMTERQQNRRAISPELIRKMGPLSRLQYRRGIGRQRGQPLEIYVALVPR